MTSLLYYQHLSNLTEDERIEDDFKVYYIKTLTYFIYIYG